MAGIGQGRQNRQTGRGGLEGGAPALTCRSLRAERRSDLRTKLPLVTMQPTAAFQSKRVAMPPSTANGEPVTKLALSDNKNNAD